VPNWDDQGKQYAAFIEAELKAENDRRESLNNRAASTLTGTAAFFTLSVAAIAVFAGKDFVVTGSAKSMLARALVILFLAAIFAGVAQLPTTGSAITAKSMRSFLEEPTSKGKQGWTNTEVRARNFTARANVRAIESMRTGTNVKGSFLLLAVIFQILALFLLGLCVFAVAATKQAQSPIPPPAPCCTVSCCSPPSTTTLTATPDPSPMPDPSPVTPPPPRTRDP
jgi:hypothetical protein